jgi:hypothetical protein
MQLTLKSLNVEQTCDSSMAGLYIFLSKYAGFTNVSNIIFRPLNKFGLKLINVNQAYIQKCFYNSSFLYQV